VGYRYGLRYNDIVIYHIDMVILDIDMGYGLMIWETTVSIWSSPISMWDISSLCLRAALHAQLVAGQQGHCEFIFNGGPISVYRRGEMPMQSCEQSVSDRLNARTELRARCQRSALEAMYRNRPIDNKHSTEIGA
jgi:hypothetical protein